MATTTLKSTSSHGLAAPSLAQVQLLQTLRTTTQTLTTQLTTLAQDTTLVLNHYMQVHPPLKTFVTTAGVLSAVPVAVFLGWIVVSCVGTFVVALLSTILLESTLVSVGFFILLPIEACILFVAGAAAAVRYGGGRWGDAVEGVVRRIWILTGEVYRLIGDRIEAVGKVEMPKIERRSIVTCDDEE
ncbi:hypothetical protein SpCBS45565_g06775 [Spizellomyces sp. 'palustris']|nr:hypothetical protein SpCBS45565_g06775 [Spizellomyces sp. 'palustris']